MALDPGNSFSTGVSLFGNGSFFKFLVGTLGSADRVIFLLAGTVGSQSSIPLVWRSWDRIDFLIV